MAIQGIGNQPNAWMSGGNPGASTSRASGSKSSQGECQTCKNRKYQDGSDEMVSFKSAAHISPNASGSRVRAHEQEHVNTPTKRRLWATVKLFRQPYPSRPVSAPNADALMFPVERPTHKLNILMKIIPIRRERKRRIPRFTPACI